MVALSFCRIFRMWEKMYKNTCYKKFAINSFALLSSSRFNLHVYFRLFCQPTSIEMPSSIQKEKITCENCGSQTTRNNIVRHRKRCSACTLYCTHCPNFSTKSQSDLNHRIAKKHSAQNLMSPSSVNFVIKSFQDFTLYVNIETFKTQNRLDQKQKMWMWNI